MNIQPLGERVLLELVKKETQTKGGIYIPDEAQESKKEGIVAGVGTFDNGRELPLKKGDKVLYGGYSSEEFEIEGKKMLLINFKDILAKLG